MERKNVNVFMAGHVDHGKTSLVKALTRTDTDRLPEEKKRGITIDLGFAFLETPEAFISFIDPPGHENFVRNMIAGVCGADICIFAVDSREGVKPQTKEHAFILKTAGIKRVLAAVTKTDATDGDTVKKILKETEAFLGRYFEKVSVLPVSIYEKDKIEKLKAAISAEASAFVYREEKPFRMSVDRAFSLQGFGTVVTGSMSGLAEKGGRAFLWPKNIVCRIKKIETGGKEAENISHGRAALNLAGVSVKDAGRGSVVFSPGAYIPQRRFLADMETAGKTPVKNNGGYNIFIGAAKLTGRVLTDRKTLILDAPYPARPGDPFFIRGGSPETTLAGGRIKEIWAPRPKSSKVKDGKKRLPTPEKAEEERVLKTLLEAEGALAEGTLISLLDASGKTYLKILRKLENEGQIINCRGFLFPAQLFEKHAETIKKIIEKEGFAEILSVKTATGLSRDKAAALLDKGDRLLIWRNSGGKRTFK